MDNLFAADGAVSPDRAAAPAEEARQRLDTVTAVTFPACHDALASGPTLTTVGHWPT